MLIRSITLPNFEALNFFVYEIFVYKAKIGQSLKLYIFENKYSTAQMQRCTRSRLATHDSSTCTWQ